MSSRVAQCPSCGGEVLFRAGSSLVSVCPHCRAAVSRKGVNLEAIGTVAELVPTSSPFKVGMEGRPAHGYRPFRIAGRMQLSTGQGTWDEWYLAFDDGRFGWLAEAQGQFYLMKPMAGATAPEFETIQPGQRLDLSPYGSWVVNERRQAVYVSAEGELPSVDVPGSTFRYADLSGDDGAFATLDYGDDPGLDALYVGKNVELKELGIPGLVAWEKRAVGAKAGSLNCPSCGGALSLKDPQNTVRIACQYCGSLLGEKEDGGGKFEVLQRLKKVPLKPEIPLGSEGTLGGHEYVVLGLVGKSTEAEGVLYYWGEYLLKEKKTEAYHWLAVSNGHWTLLEPIPAAEVKGANAGVDRKIPYKDRVYSLFQTSAAKVEAVLGEFYWTIQKGETTQTADYVAPPRMLSSELAESEINWTEGAYVTKEELEQAFALKEPLSPPTGIAPNQPWPGQEKAKIVKRWAGRFALAALVLFALLQLFSKKAVIYQMRQEIQEGPDVPKDANVVLTETIEMPRTTNVEVRLDAPTENNWVGVGASLIQEGTGEVVSFGLTSDYYHGVDDGESWSEGSRNRTIFLSRVPQGRYTLRLEPEFEAGKAPPYYDIRLRAGVPRFYRLVWALILISIWPLKLLFSRIGFESRRWAESEYGSSGSSSSSSSSSDDD